MDTKGPLVVFLFIDHERCASLFRFWRLFKKSNLIVARIILWPIMQKKPELKRNETKEINNYGWGKLPMSVWWFIFEKVVKKWHGKRSRRRSSRSRLCLLIHPGAERSEKVPIVKKPKSNFIKSTFLTCFFCSVLLLRSVSERIQNRFSTNDCFEM